MHRFVNFKGFADAELDLDQPVTLLIGKNGSGKTNAIEGIELLTEIARGRPLREISDVGRGGGFEVRGGLAGCVRAEGKTFQLQFSHDIPRAADEALHLEYTVEVSAKPEPTIVSESLVISGRVLFTTGMPNDTNGSGLNRLRYGRINGGETMLAADRSTLPQFAAAAARSADERLKVDANVVASLGQYLCSSFAFDPIPNLMRQYDRIGNRVLAKHAANLSPVLYGLHTGSEEEKAALARILSQIKQLPEEPFEDFGFVTTDLGDVMFGLRERPDGPLIDARLLSDGTLRCLAVLTSLETTEQSSLVIIEEFDNGLHPSRAAMLVNAIWEASERRKLNVLCTTHNPAVLDALTPEQLKGVVVAYWDKQQKASRLMRLLDLPHADVLLERGHLGDLVTRRILEQHLMPGFEEKQQEEAQAWLESLP